MISQLKGRPELWGGVAGMGIPGETTQSQLSSVLQALTCILHKTTTEGIPAEAVNFVLNDRVETLNF